MSATSSGTLVAAGLESAGYAAQSIVLSDLSPLLVACGVLIFIGMCSRTLFTIISEGNYVDALKILVYPMLVVFCLETTTASSGADWQFGNLKGDQELMKSFVDKSVKANVSFPFEIFNRFVSGMSQLGIGLILENPVSGTVLFTVRQQLLDSILKVELLSSGLRSLVHEGLQGKCGTWMDASRKIARGNRDPMYQGTPDYNNAMTTYQRLDKEPSIRLQTTGPSYTYILNLLNAINSAGPARSEAENLVREMCEGTNGVLNPEGGSAQSLVDAPISCSQIWCWSGLGLVIEARAALEEAVNSTVEQNPTYKSLAPESKAYYLQKILEDIARKVSPDDDGVTGLDPDPSVLPVVIAGYLLRRELSQGPRGTVYSEFAEKSDVGLSAYQTKGSLTDEEKALLRENQSDYTLTMSAANQMMSFAYSLPYLQGVLLFTLAALFPFFVITTGVTRQGGGLLFWAGAWVWLKSWDIGWAVVMLIDQLIWEFMPHHSIYIPAATGINSPITVMESAFDADPTYSLATYYLLISMLLISIPSVTGQIFLRGSQSISQVLFGGVQKHGTTPAAKIEDQKRKSAFDQAKKYAPNSSLTVNPESLLGRAIGSEPARKWIEQHSPKPSTTPPANNTPATTPANNNSNNATDPRLTANTSNNPVTNQNTNQGLPDNTATTPQFSFIENQTNGA